MTVSTKTTIKSFFQTGDFPTQSNFSDFIDSALFLAETTSQTVQGSIVVSGSATVSDNLSVTGDFHVVGSAGLKNISTGNILATGSATISDDIHIQGSATISKSISVTGSASITDDLHVLGSATITKSISIAGSAAVTDNLNVGANLNVISNVSAATYKLGATSVASGTGLFLPATGNPAVCTGGTEAARFLSNLQFLVNCTTAPSASVPGMSFSNPLNVAAGSSSCGSTTSAVPHFNFINGNGVVGSISTNGTATAFNVSSDKRLKENPRPMNPWPIINALNLWEFDWKANKKTGYGVFAQDTYKVYPQAVTPGKDDIGADGKLVQPWVVDYNAFMPFVLAALQDINQRLEKGNL